MNGFEPKQFGKYYLIEKIAVGGMAEIYKAKTFGVDGFEKILVIKRILPHCAADKDFIQMLTDEAKLSVLLSHANIVQVFDLGKIGDDYFIAMEYIHGVNLRDVMYRCRELQKPMPQEISVYIISEICKGLDYAHRKTSATGEPLNIIHRDISPQNILLSYEGEVKIVDFGIAKAAMNISHTMAGILKGKIAYMSPEQAMGKTIDHRTDIFSAGILLYEALTNTKLFTGESQFEVLKKIRTTKIDASKLPPSIPDPLKSIIAKALAYRPEDRYKNAGDMQIDLTKYLYSTYIDFSPRKLAAFIREMFAQELKEEQIKRARTAALESQTTSMSVEEGARQIEIVHRETSVTPLEGTRELPKIPEERLETMITPIVPEVVEEEITAKKEKKAAVVARKKKRHPIAAALTLLAIILAVYAAFKYTPLTFLVNVWDRIIATKEAEKAAAPALPTKPAEIKPELTGTLNIITEPPGAAILIDGKTTGAVSPATIEKLALNTDIKITLSKPEYQDFEQVINLKSSEPQKISAVLLPIAPPAGSVAVTLKPDGAKILLNNEDTGKTTPAIIDNLKLNEPYTIKLAKEGFETWTKTFTLTSPEQIKLEGELKTMPQVAQGSIRITSNPTGADIMLDGVSTGRRTPATISNLELGKTYNIRLEKQNYKSWSRKIEVADAKQISVSGRLEPLAPTEEKPPPPLEKPAVTEKPSIPEAAEVKGEPGVIKIASNPSGAQVFINREYRGTTPLSVSVPPGRTSVLVSKEGFAKFSKTITLKPGQKVDLTDIKLGDLYGEVSLNSTPPRATVTFDGQVIPAKTPVTIRKVRKDEPHTVSISLPGYKTWSRTFSMEEGDKSFNIILEPE